MNRLFFFLDMMSDFALILAPCRASNSTNQTIRSAAIYNEGTSLDTACCKDAPSLKQTDGLSVPVIYCE
jgi:hypothetical protein